MLWLKLSSSFLPQPSARDWLNHQSCSTSWGERSRTQSVSVNSAAQRLGQGPRDTEHASKATKAGLMQHLRCGGPTLAAGEQATGTVEGGHHVHAGFSPNQRRLRHHAQHALRLVKRARPLASHASTPCSLNWNACGQRKPRPSLEAPPPKPVSTERTCVKVRPRPYPLFRAESLGSLSLSPHSSRCRSRVSGREQRRAASPPPSGRARARSPAPSSPHPGRVPEGPSPCPVPEGHRGRRHGS